MTPIIAHFEQLTRIPRCSGDTEQMKQFLIDFASGHGYETQVDQAQNILICRGKPALCLQAHYDMVCMGSAPRLETYIKDGWMYAKGASLGADNGMAIAMMMALMEQGRELEFLLTADEEIGLIGAGALGFELQSPVMLNLDSEDEAEVYIGCAGGVDIVAKKTYPQMQDLRRAYRIKVSDLPGGHSGVDIDKAIPNALKRLAAILKEARAGLVSLHGGVRRNAIPAEAEAVIRCETPPSTGEHCTAEPIQSDAPIFYGGEEIIDLLHGFANGVREMNRTLEIPECSINLAIVSAKQGHCTVETSARAMSSEGLAQVSAEAIAHFEAFGYEIKQTDKYPSWKPEINDFTQLVYDCVKEVFGTVEMKAIHAGLECGIISECYPQIRIASIGPTIRYPHSTRECVDLDSVERTFAVVQRVIARCEV
jgi:dipeptidase D